MQLKLFLILLLLVAQDSILKIGSFSPYRNNMNKNPRGKFHSKSFLEISSKEKNNNKNKIKNNLKNKSQFPSFSYGNFNFVIAYQLLGEIIKNNILSSDNMGSLSLECFKSIYHRQNHYANSLEKFWSLMFSFYVSERFLKNTSNANMMLVNAFNQIKNIFNSTQDDFVIFNGFKRNCYGVFNFAPSMNKEDILNLLSFPQYFGEINNTYGAQPFIDSQFSIYRDRLPEDSFKKLNFESRRNNNNNIGNEYNLSNANFLRSILVDRKIDSNNGFYNKNRYNRKDYLYKPNINYYVNYNNNQNNLINDNEYNINSNNENFSSKNDNIKQNDNLNNDPNIDNLKNNETKDGIVKDNSNNRNKKIPIQPFHEEEINKNKEENEGKNEENKKDNMNKNLNESENFNKNIKDNYNFDSPNPNENVDKNKDNLNNKVNKIIENNDDDDLSLPENEKFNNNSKSHPNSLNGQTKEIIEKSKDIKNNNKNEMDENEKSKINGNDNSKINDNSTQENRGKNNHSESNLNNKVINQDLSKKINTNDDLKNNQEDKQNANNPNKNNSKEIRDSFDNSNEFSKKLNDNNDIFNLIVFGNVGEIEYFNNLKKLANQNENPISFHNNILQKENIILNNENNVCILKTQNESIQLNNAKGLVNFNNLFFNKKTLEKLEKANSLFFIGDIINVGKPEISEKNENLNISNDYKEKLALRIECAWNLFFDSLSKVKFMQNNGKNHVIREEIDVLLGKMTFEDNTQKNFEILNQIERAKNKNPLNNDLLIKDVRHGTEQNSNKKKRSNSYFLENSPKMTTIKFKDFHIQFLDFNSFILICLIEENEEEYYKCLNKNNIYLDHNSNNNKKFLKSNRYLNEYNSEESRQEQENDLDCEEDFANNNQNKNSNNSFNSNNEKIFNYTNARKYAWILHNMISEKFYVQSRDISIWKFMRAVHAPISTYPYDNEFYFKDLKVLNLQGKQEKINLIKQMHKKNINLFISSQVKAAQVLAYPYSREFKFVENNKNCLEKFSNYGCAQTRDNKLFRRNVNFISPKKCLNEKNGIMFNLPINIKIIEPSQTILYVFNIGNSGTTLDKINTGKASNGYIVWERSIALENEEREIINSNYGFTNFAISRDYIEVKFYEMKEKNDIVNTVIFNISDNIMPDQNLLNSVIEENYCKEEKN